MKLFVIRRSSLCSRPRGLGVGFCLDAHGPADRTPAALLMGAAMLAAFGAEAGAQAPSLQFALSGKHQLPPVLETTTAMVRGDVDGDGDLDLVTCSGDQSWRNRLYLNDGSGIFTDVTATNLPAAPFFGSSLALGDIDGDGDLDLVIGSGSWLGGQDVLFLNNGSGVFTDVTAARLPTTTLSYNASVALADFDGDGDLDLLLGRGGQGLAWLLHDSLLLNDGRGNFTDATATHWSVGYRDTTCLAVGDVDGDGDLDVVLGSGGYLGRRSTLWINNGSGVFRGASAGMLPAFVALDSVALGDVDGDGDLDLLAGNGTGHGLFLNNGSGTFASASSNQLPGWTGYSQDVALGDIDGDGDLDLVFANAGYQATGEQNRIFVNDGTGTFTEATAGNLPASCDTSTCVVLGDVDGDGDLDLMFGNGSRSPDRNCLYLNDGRGHFDDGAARELPDVIGDVVSVALGDIDGDGDLDLAVGKQGGYYSFWLQNRLYLNDGNGSFTDATAARMPVFLDHTWMVAFGDIDRDGDLDLAIANGPSRQNRLYLNNGQGTFTDATGSRLPAISDWSTSVAFGDVDGDRDLDLVFGNWGQQTRLYLNSGSGGFVDVTSTRLMGLAIANTNAVAFGDVDGDGDLDLVVGNSSNSTYGMQNHLLINNGGLGSFSDFTSIRMPVVLDRTNALALGDVDRDGDLDIVAGNQGQDQLLLNNGNGFFTLATASHLPVDSDSTRAVQLSDVDGDGDLDLVAGTGIKNRLYLNDGNGIFTDATATAMPAGSDGGQAVAVGDIDGDADPDQLLVGTWRNFVYRNLHRQLHTPYTLRPGYPFPLDLHAANTTASSILIALPFLSWTRVRVPLPPYGSIGITPDAGLGLAVIPSATGVARIVVNVPNQPALVGLQVFAQAMFVSAGGGIQLSNVTADRGLR